MRETGIISHEDYLNNKESLTFFEYLKDKMKHVQPNEKRKFLEEHLLLKQGQTLSEDSVYDYRFSNDYICTSLMMNRKIDDIISKISSGLRIPNRRIYDPSVRSPKIARGFVPKYEFKQYRNKNGAVEMPNPRFLLTCYVDNDTEGYTPSASLCLTSDVVLLPRTAYKFVCDISSENWDGYQIVYNSEAALSGMYVDFCEKYDIGGWEDSNKERLESSIRALARIDRHVKPQYGSGNYFIPLGDGPVAPLKLYGIVVIRQFTDDYRELKAGTCLVKLIRDDTPNSV